MASGPWTDQENDLLVAANFAIMFEDVAFMTRLGALPPIRIKTLIMSSFTEHHHAKGS